MKLNSKTKIVRILQFELSPRCLCASVVNRCSDTVPEINRRKQGEAGESSYDFSLVRMFGPELALGKFGPGSASRTCRAQVRQDALL